MTTRAVATLFAAVLAFGAVIQVFLPLRARAQTPHHHPLHEDFYRTWRPNDNPNTSCCNARITTNGVETGDCEPTEAKIVNGQWYARLPPQYRSMGDKDGYIPVPDVKILRERNPNVFDGHLCWTPHRGVVCFVPPDTGG